MSCRLRSRGRERLVEVKTTAYGRETPFFVTRNEVEVSGKQDDQYFLYRYSTSVPLPDSSSNRDTLRERLCSIPYSMWRQSYDV
jgi:Protein NO VEIN, C-terminal